MSSSSSTDCDCFYCQYGIGYACNDYDAYAFYPTMVQPWVYYAQVPPPRDQMDRRKNPNCFVRAFRWYTQEHVSQAQAQATLPAMAQNMAPAQVQNMTPTQAQNTALAQAQNITSAQAQNMTPAQAQNTAVTQAQNVRPAQAQNTTTPAQAQCTETTISSGADPDVEGFANWLDAKYEQYLREGHAYEYRCMVFTQTSEGMGVQPQCQSQPGRTKRFARLRLQSPWRKRRGCKCTNNASEGGDFPIDANKSVVFLLEPKDLPRPISECCHVSSTPCCSVPTVVKKIACSRSATDTFTRSEVAHIDPVSVQEGITSDKPQQFTEHGRKQESHKKADSENFLQNDTSNIEKHKNRNKSKTESLLNMKKTETPVSLHNASCECSTLPSPRPVVETGTQYDTVVKFACECVSKQTFNDSVACCPVPIDPVPTAPVALAEAKHKETWFPKNLSKKLSKTFSLKPQKDVECQCEPTPKVDESQCCTQCRCRCMEMREKLLCCDCMRTACGEETSAPVMVNLQMKDAPLPQLMQKQSAPKPPLPMQQEYALKPYMQPPPVQQQRASKLDMPPIPPPTQIQQEYAPKPIMPPPVHQQRAPKLDMTPIPPPTPIPQPLREMSVINEPKVLVIPPSLELPSQMLVSPAPVNSELYAIKGRPLGRTSFPCLVCNSVQTSDHAIDLDQGTIRGHPLFLQIVCTDRLNEDCLCRQ